MYAALRGLPGIKYDVYGRWLGLKFGVKYFNKGRNGLLLNPISLTRYFEFDFAGRYVQQFKGVKLLDVSSPRIFPIWAADACECQVVMINPDSSDLEASKKLSVCMKNRDRITFDEGVDAIKLPYADNAFDMLTSISVIEHIDGDGDSKALDEFVRVVRPRGVIILSFPVNGNYYEEYRSHDPYGTQEKDNRTGLYFFQRFYDEGSMNMRLLGKRSVRVISKEYYVEAYPGWFDSYIQKCLKEGLQQTHRDPYFVVKYFIGPITTHPEDRMGNCSLALQVVK